MHTRPGLPSLRPARGRRAEQRAWQRLERELAAGHEHPGRATERLGEPGAARPPGPLIWLHARSEDGTLDLLALIARLGLERDDLGFLLTTDEYSPDSQLAGHLPDGCIHQFLPYGEGPGFERFLRHWRPDICIWNDSDHLPPPLPDLSEGGLSAFWVNARLPDEKSPRMRWFPSATRKELGQFAHVFAVDGRSARNFRRLGIPETRLEVLGPLHESPPPPECEEGEWASLAQLLVTRPVWFAAGVSGREISVAVSAHRAILRRAHRYLLLLSPRDKSQGAALADRLEGEGWLVARRGAGQEPGPEVQIFVADRPGETGLWFRLAPISFIGQTLAPDGVALYDPYLATSLGSVVLHGPQTGIFAQRFTRLRNAGAARKVPDEAALVREMEYLQAPDKVASMAQAAWEVSTSGAEVTNRLCRLIFERLDERGL